MTSFLLRVVCLGVLKNGTKYLFRLRKSTGDMTTVISSRGLTEMPQNIYGGGDKVGHTSWSITDVEIILVGGLID